MNNIVRFPRKPVASRTKKGGAHLQRTRSNQRQRRDPLRSKRPANLAILVLALGVAAAIGHFLTQGDPSEDVRLLASSSREHDTLSGRFPICGGGQRVTCVVDGDTFWLNRQKIRIADIDTPELSPPRCEAERIRGEAAKRRLAELLNAGAFSLVAGDREEDRYVRKLRTVTRAGASIGNMLIAEGLARPWDGGCHPWCG